MSKDIGRMPPLPLPAIFVYFGQIYGQLSSKTYNLYHDFVLIHVMEMGAAMLLKLPRVQMTEMF